MASLHDGMRLLNLPVEARKASDQSGDGEGAEAVISHGITLKEASDRVFVDNDEARKVLEELQLEALTPQNARQILQRRAENGEDVDW